MLCRKQRMSIPYFQLFAFRRHTVPCGTRHQIFYAKRITKHKTSRLFNRLRWIQLSIAYRVWNFNPFALLNPLSIVVIKNVSAVWRAWLKNDKKLCGLEGMLTKPIKAIASYAQTCHLIGRANVSARCLYFIHHLKLLYTFQRPTEIAKRFSWWRYWWTTQHNNQLRYLQEETACHRWLFVNLTGKTLLTLTAGRSMPEILTIP